MQPLPFCELLVEETLRQHFANTSFSPTTDSSSDVDRLTFNPNSVIIHHLRCNSDLPFDRMRCERPRKAKWFRVCCSTQHAAIQALPRIEIRWDNDGYLEEEVVSEISDAQTLEHFLEIFYPSARIPRISPVTILQSFNRDYMDEKYISTKPQPCLTL
jgi:hypothetical protein